MTPAILEERLRDCCGHRVISVNYHQIQNDEDDWAVHDIHPEIGDFCDFGVSLILDDRTVAYIAWDGTFRQYGLMLTRTPVTDFHPEGRPFLRTGSTPWNTLSADSITSAEIIWNDFDNGPYPQAFLFRFSSSRRLLLSAAQPMKRKDGSVELFGISDWVAILHDPKIIDQHLASLTDPG